MKILISDKLADEGVHILTDGTGFTVDCKYDLSPDELKKIINQYDALIVRSGTDVTADIIEAADRLKVIGRAGVGMDNVDLKAATKKGIVAMNTPGGNTTSTAEHTMSMILALARNIPQAYATMKQGRWDRTKFKGVELCGKTLGVVGLGRIGSTVAKMAQGFGMKIIGYDPFISGDVAEKRGIKAVALPELFAASDFITLHIPKSTETTDLINKESLATMKKSVRIINCARGGIINEQDLYDALKSNSIAGAALDVYDEEPLNPESPLLTLDNIVLTPHLGASTSEAQLNVAIEVAEQVRDALSGKGIRNAANFPSLTAEAYAVLEPYINLGSRVGSFGGQLISSPINEIKITYHGEMTSYKVAPITMALVQGLLTPILGDMINSINAIDVAKERGINVLEVQSTKPGEYVNVVQVEVLTDKEPFSIWATLSSNHQPRIVKINSVYVEATPSGTMLFINNNDKPGIVGAVGSLLAKENINIAGITFGREKQGGLAISVVNVDSAVPDSVLQKLHAEKDVLFAKVIEV